MFDCTFQFRPEWCTQPPPMPRRFPRVSEFERRCRIGLRRLNLLLNTLGNREACRLCGGKTRLRLAYRRPFSHCLNCNFIFTRDFSRRIVEKGMGMEGSWSGPTGGGYRELHLATWLKSERGKRSFFLFGTGNTPTFETLRSTGHDVVGCDITPALVGFKQRQFGADSFCHTTSLPKRKFDVIIAVEVFEHLDTPRETLQALHDLLTDQGIICGTTNFYLGGPIEDINSPGYMSHELHVAYWSHEAMQFAGEALGMREINFQMECPGSVFPDEKYGQLWPNKRVFFLCKGDADFEWLENLWHTYPILPIRKP